MSRPDGERIRECRRRKGLSVRSLARRAGLAEKTVRRLERNQVETPHPDTIRAVAGALELESEELFPAGPRAKDRTVPGFSGRPTLAVTRFEELSAGEDVPYFAAGLVEDLISRLSAWRVLPVIAPGSSLHPKLDALSAAEIGQELGARYLVRGSVRRSDADLRIAVQVVDALTEHTLWAGRFDRQLTEVLRAQDEISQEIMARVGQRVSSFESRRAMELQESELEAWDICMRGWWHVQQITLEDARKAHALFERATEIDPRLALAWVGCASAILSECRFLGSSTEHLERARQCAERAIQCDPDLAQGHAIRATVCLNLGRLPDAIHSQERALELDPSSASAYVGRAVTLAFQNRLEEARDELLCAVRLDPCSPDVPDTLRYLGLCHMMLNDFDEAAACFRKSIHHRSDLAVSYCDLAATLGLAQRKSEADALRKQLRDTIPSYSPSVLKGWLHNNAVWPAGLRERYFEGLRRAGWAELLD